MNLAIVLLSLLTLSALFVFIVERLKLPGVIGLILGGLFIGIPMVKDLIVGPHTEFVFALGDIGLLCLMFLAGFESSWKKICHEKKDSLAISTCAALTPFVLGFVVFKAFGFSSITALVVGIGMSITAEATIADMLLEMKKLKTKVGSAMMGAGIIDDVFGFLAFIGLMYLMGNREVSGYTFLIAVIAVFFVGIFVRVHLKKEHPFIQVLEKLLKWLVIPFFFISVGLNFDMNSLVVSTFPILLIIMIALVGKIGGSLLAKPFTDLSWRQLHLIGWAMNSRGAMGMALVLIAYNEGLLSVEIYSGLVIMALVTTLVFPFVINRILHHHPRVME